jgi:predicted RNase H-like nuclease (RuvC/YqgF family)
MEANGGLIDVRLDVIYSYLTVNDINHCVSVDISGGTNRIQIKNECSREPGEQLQEQLEQEWRELEWEREQCERERRELEWEREQYERERYELRWEREQHEQERRERAQERRERERRARGYERERCQRQREQRRYEGFREEIRGIFFAVMLLIIIFGRP